MSEKIHRKREISATTQREISSQSILTHHAGMPEHVPLEKPLIETEEEYGNMNMHGTNNHHII